MARMVINAMLDEQAGVWVASSGDVPGLATESASLDALARKLQQLVPELCELNGVRMARGQGLELRLRLPPKQPA